jgi:hypothetical protein
MSRRAGDESPEEKTVDEWCDQQDIVPDGDRIYRCTKCRKRLHPREIWEDGRSTGWRLPPHKKKGHKIRAAKLRQRGIRKGGGESSRLRPGNRGKKGKP